MTVKVLETERLILRWLTDADAEFILDLLNQPSWLEFIGDRGVHNREDALGYIHGGPLAMIEKYGFGLYLVEIKSSRQAIGLCGLLKRENLEDVDIGFAFHPDFWGQGYAREAASACVQHARDKFGLDRLVAITMPSNHSCIALLKTIGMQHEKDICFGETEKTLHLFSRDFS